VRRRIHATKSSEAPTAVYFFTTSERTNSSERTHYSEAPTAVYFATPSSVSRVATPSETVSIAPTSLYTSASL